jgi:hypothetical protein
MTESNVIPPRNSEEEKLPRRDWVLLPALSLLTVFLIVGCTELIARRIFTYSDTGVKDCTVLSDLSTGPRGIPNCVCWEKGYEYQPIEYRFNGSGYRADTEFGPKPLGTYRIVMVGSSVAMGFGVESKSTFAALLPEELSRRTGSPVELLNESIGGNGGVASRFDSAFAYKPDMILWILTPWDIEQGFATVNHVKRADRSVPFASRAWRRIELAFSGTSFTSAIEKAFDLTRSSLLLRHFLFESQNQYVTSYLMSGDKEAGFLKAEPGVEWKQHLRQLSVAVADNEALAKAAGVPLVAVLVPNRAQAAMVSMGTWPAGYDPYKLDREVRSVMTGQGGTYIDILSGYRGIPNPEQYYFPVDGHPDANGHAIISRLIANALTSGAVPALSQSASALRASVQPQPTRGPE